MADGKALADIVSDAEVERVHANANFGSMSKREVVDEGLLKYAFGYTSGSTQLAILKEHRLLRKGSGYEAVLSKKGYAYLRAMFAGVPLTKIMQTRAPDWKHLDVEEMITRQVQRHKILSAGATPDARLLYADLNSAIAEVRRLKEALYEIEEVAPPHLARICKRALTWRPLMTAMTIVPITNEMVGRGISAAQNCPAIPANVDVDLLVRSVLEAVLALPEIVNGMVDMTAKPDADGWITHSGGECPVDAETFIEYRTRSGAIYTRSAGRLAWSHDPICQTDIVAYRIIYPNPTQAATLTADDQKAMADQIAALEASSLGTACGCGECQELAERDMKLAARLRAKLDSIPLREVKE